MTGVPVLFGPNMWNVVDSVQLLLGTGGVQVENSARLKQAVFDLLDNDSLRMSSDSGLEREFTKPVVRGAKLSRDLGFSYLARHERSAQNVRPPHHPAALAPAPQPELAYFHEYRTRALCMNS